jgi:uncharacterized protein YciI
MPFLIIARDKPGMAERRAELRPAHLEHLERHAAKLLAAGAMLAEDGTSAVGSLILFDSEDRAAVEMFLAADSFTAAGLFESVEIRPWRKVFLAGARTA